MKVFVSVGAQYNDQQRAFVAAFDTFLVANGCRKLTVDDRRSDQPIFAAREMMQDADAVVVVAFTRYIVKTAVEKPGSPEEKTLKNTRYPTIWNQLEAAMAFGLHLPLLVIIEDGLHQEAMLKDRHEFRTVITDLDPKLFSSDMFKDKFKHWMERVKEPRNRITKNIADATIGQLVSLMRPDQAWKIAGAIIGLVTAIATAAFWIGKHL